MDGRHQLDLSEKSERPVSDSDGADAAVPASALVEASELEPQESAVTDVVDAEDVAEVQAADWVAVLAEVWVDLAAESAANFRPAQQCRCM